MSEKQSYKISYETVQIARVALVHHERTVKDWIELEGNEPRLQEHLRAELVSVQAGLKELRSL